MKDHSHPIKRLGLTGLVDFNLPELEDVVAPEKIPEVSPEYITCDKRSSELTISAYHGDCHKTTKLLRDSKADINFQDDLGRTALMAATQQGHINVVHLLLATGADVRMKTYSGKSALFYAVMERHREIVERLVNHCPDLLTDGDQQGRIVLFMCVLNRRYEMLELLHSLGADLDAQDHKGRTPLMAASQEGHGHIVRYLLDHSTSDSLGMRSHNGECALDFAVTNNKVGCLKLLLDKTEMIDMLDINWDTPLIKAVAVGNLETVQLLAEASMNINHQSKHNRTALMVASVNNQADVIEFLISKGADVNLRSENGLTALFLARALGYEQVLRVLIKAGAVDQLSGYSNNVAALLLAASLADPDLLLDMIQQGADVNICGDNGLSALMVAAQNGLVQNVRCLIEQNAKINHRTKDGATALTYAIDGQNLEIIDMLLGNDADLNMQNEDNKSLLYMAAEDGNQLAVEKLVHLGADVNQFNNNNRTALMAAALNGSKGIVEFLLKVNADSQFKCSEGMDAVQYAFVGNHETAREVLQNHQDNLDEFHDNGHRLIVASHQGDIQEVQNLLDRGVPVNFPDNVNRRSTPLIVACLKGHYEVVQLLIACGANVNKPDNDANTPVFIAATQNHLQILKLLIIHGGIVNCLRRKSRIPLVVAASRGNMDVVKCLVENGALVNVTDSKGNTALFCAVGTGNLDIIQYLLQKGSKVDCVDVDYHTPLVMAALHGHIVIVEKLVQYNADVNHTDYLGRTALMAATQDNHLNVVKYLVERGADINIRTKQGYTVKELAAQTGMMEICEYLLGQGSNDPIKKFIDIDGLIEAYQRFNKKFKGIEFDQEESNPVTLTDLINKNNSQEQVYSSNGVQYAMISVQKAQKELFKMCSQGTGDESNLTEILEKGVDVNFPNEQGQTPLIKSTSKGNSSHTKWLVSQGANVNCIDGDGNTPLILSSEQGDLDTVQLLLQHGADKNINNSHGSDALMSASRKGFSHVVEFLKNYDGGEITRSNLEHGSKLNDGPNGSCPTELMMAAYYGNVLKVEELCEDKSMIDVRDSNGKTALSYCCEGTSPTCLETAKVLCDNGANINNADVFGDTPLLVTVDCRNSDLAKYLIDMGADIYSSNLNGENVLSEISICGDMDILSSAFQKVRYCDEHVFRVIQRAIFQGNCDIIDSLLHHSLIDLSDITLENGESILFLTVNQNSVTLTSKLLEHELDVNQPNDDGQTCLMAACTHGYVDLVTCLLDNNADLSMVDNYGDDAMSLALTSGQYETAQHLLEVISGFTMNIATENGYLIVVDPESVEHSSLSGCESDDSLDYKLEPLLPITEDDYTGDYTEDDLTKADIQDHYNDHTKNDTEGHTDYHTLTQDHTKVHIEDHTQSHTQDYTEDHSQNHSKDHIEDHTQDHIKDHIVRTQYHTEDHTQDQITDQIDHTQDHAEDHTQDHTEDHTQDHTEDHTQDHTEDHTQDHTEDHTQNHTEDHTQDHTEDHIQNQPQDHNDTQVHIEDHIPSHIEDHTSDHTQNHTEDHTEDYTEDHTQNHTQDHTKGDQTQNQPQDHIDTQGHVEDHIPSHTEDHTRDHTQNHMEDHTEDHTEDNTQNHTHDHTKDYTKDHAQNHTQDHTEDHTENHTQDHTKDYTKDHIQDHTEDYTEDHTQNHTQDHTPDHTKSDQTENQPQDHNQINTDDHSQADHPQEDSPGSYLQKYFTAVYAKVATLLTNSCPDGIQGYSRNWHTEYPVIYIHITSPDIQPQVHEYIQTHISPHTPLIQIKYIVQPNRPYPTMDPNSNNLKPKPGAVIAMAERNGSTNEMKRPFCALGCFISGNINNGGGEVFIDLDAEGVGAFWGVTVGHTFLHSKNYSSAKYCINNNLNILSTNNQVNREDEIISASMNVISSSCYAAVDVIDEDDGPKLVDIAMFPISNSYRRHNKLETGHIISHAPSETEIKLIDNLSKTTSQFSSGCFNCFNNRHNLSVFQQPDIYLVGKSVCKTGYISGYTEGEIIDAGIGMKWNDTTGNRNSARVLPGTFVVVNKQGSNVWFAEKGESGVLVYDSGTGAALGLVVAVHEHYVSPVCNQTYHKVAYCMRLSAGLTYVQQQWKQELRLGKLDDDRKLHRKPPKDILTSVQGRLKDMNVCHLDLISQLQTDNHVIQEMLEEHSSYVTEKERVQNERISKLMDELTLKEQVWTEMEKCLEAELAHLKHQLNGENFTFKQQLELLSKTAHMKETELYEKKCLLAGKECEIAALKQQLDQKRNEFESGTLDQDTLVRSASHASDEDDNPCEPKMLQSLHPVLDGQNIRSKANTIISDGSGCEYYKFMPNKDIKAYNGENPVESDLLKLRHPILDDHMDIKRKGISKSDSVGEVNDVISAGENHTKSNTGENHTKSNTGENHTKSNTGENHTKSNTGENQSNLTSKHKNTCKKSNIGENQSDGNALPKTADLCSDHLLSASTGPESEPLTGKTPESGKHFDPAEPESEPLTGKTPESGKHFDPAEPESEPLTGKTPESGKYFDPAEPESEPLTGKTPESGKHFDSKEPESALTTRAAEPLQYYDDLGEGEDNFNNEKNVMLLLLGTLLPGQKYRIFLPPGKFGSKKTRPNTGSNKQNVSTEQDKQSEFLEANIYGKRGFGTLQTEFSNAGQDTTPGEVSNPSQVAISTEVSSPKEGATTMKEGAHSDQGDMAEWESPHAESSTNEAHQLADKKGSSSWEETVSILKPENKVKNGRKSPKNKRKQVGWQLPEESPDKEPSSLESDKCTEDQIAEKLQEKKMSGIAFLAKHFNLKKRRLGSQQKKTRALIQLYTHPPKIFYIFPVTVCDSYGYRFPLKASGIITLLYAYKFKKEPTDIRLYIADVTDKINDQIIEAISEGNQAYRDYYHDERIPPEISDIMLMAHNLNIKIVNELEFESDHIGIVSDYVVQLKNNQILLLLRPYPYKVVSIFICDRMKSIQMLDSQAHPLIEKDGITRLSGAILFYTCNSHIAISKLLEDYCHYNHRLEGKCKFAIIEMD